MNQSSNYFNLKFMFYIELINDGHSLSKAEKALKMVNSGKTLKKLQYLYPGGIFLFKVNNGNTKPVCEIYFNNKDTKATSLTSFCCLIVNFSVFMVDFKQVNASWIYS